MQRLVLIVLLVLLPMCAVADGKFYSRQTAVAANVIIPDQRALIHYTNGTERLVIETRFTGDGTNFAWVVPLPSKPIVEAASPGLFPTLQHLFQPPITHHIPRYYIGILVVVGFAYLIRLTLQYTSGITVVITILFLLLLLATLLLPSLAKSRAGAISDSANPSVSILDRQLVGVFETTTIASHDPQALQAWLRDNGFVVTTNSVPVIESYVKDGWVFVAAKVRRDQNGNQTSTPHPLSFTFKTEKPVYPMRLTGVDNGPLRVEMYVFADHRAQADRFKVERCVRPDYPATNGVGALKSLEMPRIIHPILRDWVGGAPVATKLTATLSPKQMRKDVWIEWRDYVEKKNRRFSREGAGTIALNWSASLLAVGLALGYVLTSRIRPESPNRSIPIPFALAASLVAGGLIYLILPKTEVRLVRHYYSDTRNAQYYPLFLVEDSSLEDARRLLADPTNNVTKAIWDGYFAGGQWPLLGRTDSRGRFSRKFHSARKGWPRGVCNLRCTGGGSRPV